MGEKKSIGLQERITAVEEDLKERGKRLAPLDHTKEGGLGARFRKGLQKASREKMVYLRILPAEKIHQGRERQTQCKWFAGPQEEWGRQMKV